MQFKVLIKSKNENEKVDASKMTEAEAKVDRDRFELIMSNLNKGEKMGYSPWTFRG
jgi:hypothetical protein